MGWCCQSKKENNYLNLSKSEKQKKKREISVFVLKYVDWYVIYILLEPNKNMVAKINILYYAAAATTAIAGILHLIQASNSFLWGPFSSHYSL